MRRSPHSLTALGLGLALLGTGCGGYWPLRWPARDLWAALPGDVPSLQVPAGPLTGYSHQLTQDGVAVGIEFLTAPQAREMFHVDLAGNGIQPLLVAIQNASGRPWRLRKSEMGLRVIPAARVAALACPDPVRSLARYVKWLVFFIPGLVFETVVEPTSTLDFPIMHDASRHPAASGCRHLREDFVRQELADGEIAPGQLRSGVVFVPPVRLGSTVSLTLTPAGNQEKVAWVFPTPPPIYSRTELYSHPPTIVWDAARKAVGRVVSWRIERADRAKGTIGIRKGWRWLPGSSYASILVTVQEAGTGLTRVRVETPLPRPTSVHYGEHSRTIDRFFQELARKLPSPPPPTEPGGPAKLGGQGSPVAEGGGTAGSQHTY